MRQTSSVKEYQSQFERLANRTDGLSDSFFISCFVCGLKEEIRMDVQMFHPTTLTAVIELTHLQEEKLKARRRFPQFDTNKVSPSLLPNPPKVGTPPINRLTPMEAKERRKHGLCFNCDEKFHRGHRCKTKTLFLIEGNWPDDGDNEEVIAEPEVQMVALLK